MEYTILGRSGLKVSKFCFGSLTVGPLQKDMTVEDGAKVIAHAFDKGINFIDTAKLYKTYPYIKRALELTVNKDIIISSKSYDYTYEGMKESVAEAIEELGVRSIGLFSLHEQESRLTLKGHREALEYLIEAKKKGIIKAVGVSTHAVEVVRAVCTMDEIDVIHPIYNQKGLGVLDGTGDDMEDAIKAAYKDGIGIFSMKPLGGGNLIGSYEEALSFVLDKPFVHSVAIGMQSELEVDTNIAFLEGKSPDEDTLKKLSIKSRELHIDEWCEGCGKCADFCQQKALSIIDGKAVVNRDKCVLCGYCSSQCPNFYIKVI